jgi:hypothetical protein
MQSICYRCGGPLEGQTTFCPACGAPQIRVSTPAQPAEDAGTSAPGFPSFTEAPFSASQGIALTAGIAWQDFIRAAAPQAAITGILTLLLPPLGLFVLLPANLVWAIARYLRRRPMALGSGQGARMGAMMGALSFGFFLIAFFACISLFWTEFRNVMIGRIYEIAAQNPDPQAQQITQWFATPHGFMVFTAISLGTILVIFLIIGMGSGALAVALGRARNRP